MNKQRLSAGIGTTIMVITLSACGGNSYNGPTYQQVPKDPSKAEKACQSVFGSDRKTLALLDPGESDSSTEYRITGRLETEGDGWLSLDCSVRGAQHHTPFGFTTHDVTEGGSNTSDSNIVRSGKLIGSANSYGASKIPFSPKVKDILQDATKKLAG